MGSQRLWQRRYIVPLIRLQVVGLNAGEVARLVPSTDHIEVLIQAAGEETGSPVEDVSTRQDYCVNPPGPYSPEGNISVIIHLKHKLDSPLLHWRQLDPTIKSGIIATYKISAVFS